MIIRCAWHKPRPIILGEKPPLEDRRFTDTVCDECLARILPQQEKVSLDPATAGVTIERT
jgi:hypothetical protein